jgi:hypothetical protein
VLQLLLVLPPFKLVTQLLSDALARRAHSIDVDVPEQRASLTDLPSCWNLHQSVEVLYSFAPLLLSIRLSNLDTSFRHKADSFADGL